MNIHIHVSASGNTGYKIQQTNEETTSKQKVTRATGDKTCKLNKISRSEKERMRDSEAVEIWQSQLNTIEAFGLNLSDKYHKAATIKLKQTTDYFVNFCLYLVDTGSSLVVRQNGSGGIK